LIGILISTLFINKDKYSEKGCFFYFLDLSCRIARLFRLKLSLTKIDPAPIIEMRRFPVLAEDNSDIFTVYAPKDFPGI
ncbi:velvet factor, partial [Fusarium tricinctum]